MWWLTPVIQALWRARWADHLRSGVQDQPDQHGETLSLFKKEKKKKKKRNLFMCLLTTDMLSLEKSLSLFLKWVVFLSLSCKNFSVDLQMNDLQIFFFHSVDCLFTLVKSIL